MARQKLATSNKKAPSSAELRAMQIARAKPGTMTRERNDNGLTYTEQKFVDIYIGNPGISATEAARRASPHYANPGAISCRFMSRVTVRAVIARGLKHHEQRTSDIIIRHLADQYSRLMESIKVVRNADGSPLIRGGQVVFTCDLPIVTQQAAEEIHGPARAAVRQKVKRAKRSTKRAKVNPRFVGLTAQEIMADLAGGEDAVDDDGNLLEPRVGHDPEPEPDLKDERVN